MACCTFALQIRPHHHHLHHLTASPPSSFHRHPLPHLRSLARCDEHRQSLVSSLRHRMHNVLLKLYPENAKQSLVELEQCSVSRGSESLQLMRSLLKNFVISLGIFSFSTGLFCGCAQASEATIKASHLGLKVASVLRQTGWPDEAIVFFMAMLPVLELRGAIPVGYWMQLDPLKLSVLSILGNMVPVPFIVLYMAKLANFLASSSSTAKNIVDRIFESTRRKAGPIQEFKWLGLMLFVAVPFPGTGAWTGAMASSVLGMSFWDAVSANFFGVVMAGVLVNLLVNLGFKHALAVGIGLFLMSTFMWSFLRVIMKKADSHSDP